MVNAVSMPNTWSKSIIKGNGPARTGNELDGDLHALNGHVARGLLVLPASNATPMPFAPCTPVPRELAASDTDPESDRRCV